MHRLVIQPKKATALVIGTVPLLTMIVQAQADNLSAIAGVWAVEGTSCKVKTGEADNLLIISAGGKNERHETNCQASSIRASTSDITFRNACLSEGERSRSIVTVKIIQPNKLKLKDSGFPSTIYIRCNAGNEAQTKSRGVCNSQPSFKAGSFNLSSHGYSATITSLTGPDTSEARMTGKVTRADAEEECERNPPGGEGLKPKALQKCVAGTMAKETNKEYVASANCQSRTIYPHFGETFRISGVDSIGTARILDSRKQDIGSATASGAPSIQDQFEKLCPATFRRLKRS